MTNEKPCYCQAYAWPHRPGSGRCDTPLATDFPLSVVRIVSEANGLTLAELSNGKYIVGLGYTLGMELYRFRPLIDFIISPSLAVAQDFFRRRQ